MSEQRVSQVEEIPDFQAGLAAIINKPLTAETIDTYAESALADVGELMQKVGNSYPLRHAVDGKDLEDAACTYFGLDQIEEILDHIAAKAAEIQALDAIIARVRTAEEVITPPGAIDPLEPSDSSHAFETVDKIPRLKTLLFVLANDFGVDVNDREQLKIIKGSVENNMVRQEGYYLVEAPALGRIVLVCDEHANATFVFDSSELNQGEVATEELIQLSKDELRDLLDNNPRAGQRIPYSQNFVQRIISALATPATSASEQRIDTQGGGRYLAPKVPEGVVSLYGLVKLLAVNSPAVEQAIRELEDDLGELHTYRFGSVATIGYTPEHQERIRRHLEEQGHYDEPPEDYLHQLGIAQALGVAYDVVNRAIARLGDSMGTVQQYKSKRRRTAHYSPTQQQLIRENLDAQGLFEDEPPEDYLPAAGIAKRYEVSPTTLSKIIDEVSEALGETQSFRFGGPTTIGYSPTQQKIIVDRLEEKGLLATAAPEGYISISGLAKVLGLEHPAIKKAIDELSEDLGETKAYKFTTRAATGYSPEQQNLIAAQLEANGVLDNNAPEGYLAVSGIAREWGVDNRTINKAIDELGEDLGEVMRYKFTNRVVKGYSPHQQEVIVQHIIEKSFKKKILKT